MADIRRGLPRRALTLALLGAIVLVAQRAPAAQAVSENVMVPGGLPALARALDIEVPDRALCVAQIARLVYADAKPARTLPTSPYRRLMTYLATTPASRAGSQDAVVPVPLSAAVWSRAVFQRPVSSESLFAAILSDPNAALLAHGLAALDDDTLQYLSDRPAVLTALHARHAPVFATYAAHLRIRHNRVIVPGSDDAVPLWEAVVNKRVTPADDFLLALMSSRKGRVAYLYDVIGHLDPAQAAFAMGLWRPDMAIRVERFRAFADVVSTMIPEWNATRVPFVRPAYDVLALLQRVHVDSSGAPRVPASQSLWAEALGQPSGRTNSGGPEADIVFDAASLAALVLGDSARRQHRLDQFGFGQRALSSASAAYRADFIAAIHAYPKLPILMLAIERIGVRKASVYAALARHGQQLSRLDTRLKANALAQFQGALALVERMTRVQAIDAYAAENLIAKLGAARLDEDRGYGGAIATWLDRELRPVVGATGTSLDHAIVKALAGVAQANRPVQVSWEGQQYVFDLHASEEARIRRFLESRKAPSLDAVLLDRAIQASSGRNAGASDGVDRLVAEALTLLAYAAEWVDPPGVARLDRGLAQRHDFGVNAPTASLQARTPWSLPRLVFRPSEPWHVAGALLGLDVGLAPVRLRSIDAASITSEPRLLSTIRESFVASLGLLNAYALRDIERDAIAAAITSGARRVSALVSADEDVAPVAEAIKLDGWRTRALRWNQRYAPAEVPRLFSLLELLHLGGGGDLDLRAWGMGALDLIGCLCTHTASPGLHAAVSGRHRLGVLAAAVPDLNLRIAMALHELQLPAALAASVLNTAIDDLVNEARPMHPDDWLALVRRARNVSRERVEDYVAAVTASPGPLQPLPTTRRIR